MAIQQVEKQVVQIVLGYMGITDLSMMFDCEKKVVRLTYKQRGKDNDRAISFDDLQKIVSMESDRPVSSSARPAGDATC